MKEKIINYFKYGNIPYKVRMFFFKHVHRLKRLQTLQPVVGINNCSIEIEYGRFDSYILNIDEPYSIITLDGRFVNCCAIKSLTEKQLILWNKEIDNA